ncbi:hypothetical protein E4U55_003876 [Claviceps digitariae]|nr:hypothetical protein E4U55_003876 [Claviceps digitariae]
MVQCRYLVQSPASSQPGFQPLIHRDKHTARPDEQAISSVWPVAGRLENTGFSNRNGEVVIPGCLQRHARTYRLLRPLDGVLVAADADAESRVQSPERIREQQGRETSGAVSANVDRGPPIASVPALALSASSACLRKEGRRIAASTGRYGLRTRFGAEPQAQPDPYLTDKQNPPDPRYGGL